MAMQMLLTSPNSDVVVGIVKLTRIPLQVRSQVLVVEHVTIDNCRSSGGLHSSF